MSIAFSQLLHLNKYLSTNQRNSSGLAVNNYFSFHPPPSPQLHWRWESLVLVPSRFPSLCLSCLVLHRCSLASLLSSFLFPLVAEGCWPYSEKARMLLLRALRGKFMNWDTSRPNFATSLWFALPSQGGVLLFIETEIEKERMNSLYDVWEIIAVDWVTYAGLRPQASSLFRNCMSYSIYGDEISPTFI